MFITLIYRYPVISHSFHHGNHVALIGGHLVQNGLSVCVAWITV